MSDIQLLAVPLFYSYWLSLGEVEFQQASNKEFYSLESINFHVHLLSFCETTMKILHLKNVV